MKVTFVNPSVMRSTRGEALEPLVFSILSGLTPPDIDRAYYDQGIESIPFDEPTDLVAISANTFTAKSAYQIALQFQHRGVPVVMGGYHPTLLPQEALRFSTSVVVGDAEGIWPRIIEDARKGEFKKIYNNRFPALDGLKPDRTIFAGKRYWPVSVVQFGRGCPFRCDFCSVHAVYGSVIRYRPIQEVLAELRELRHRYILIVDDNLFADLSAVTEILEAMKPLHLRWVCQVNLDDVASPDLIRLMADAGCMAVFIGFESLVAENLRDMKKPRKRDHYDYENIVKAINQCGIMIAGLFLFGYDHDSVNSFKAAHDFAVRNRFLTASFNPLGPLPRTPLYERLRQEGRLIHDPWWLHPDFRYGQSWFHPKQMTAEELAECFLKTRVEFFSFGNILRRSLNFRANCRNLVNALIYFGMNWSAKREIKRRQGQPIGCETYPNASYEEEHLWGRQ